MLAKASSVLRMRTNCAKSGGNCSYSNGLAGTQPFVVSQVNGAAIGTKPSIRHAKDISRNLRCARLSRQNCRCQPIMWSQMLNHPNARGGGEPDVLARTG
jgi:hypothetical protein